MKELSMKYYRYHPDANNFMGIHLLHQDHEVIDIRLEPLPLLHSWRPIQVEEGDENPRPNGDFPSLSNYNEIPVVTQQAWDVLRPLIGASCEALPIIHPSGEPFYLIHVMSIIDCLDTKRSRLTRSGIDGRINRISRYGFKREMLNGQHIIKLPFGKGSDLLVDDVFRKAVEENGLRGLIFNELPLTI